MPTLDLAFASGESSLSVRTFAVQEAVSSLFVVSVSARSPRPDIDPFEIIGDAAELRVDAGFAHARGASGRTWSGVARSMQLLRAEATGLSTYALEIVPKLWLLTQRTNYRVFQRLSVPEIVDEVLAGWQLAATWHIDRDACPRYELRVQYGESDYDFVARLLEAAGITYTFVDGDPAAPSELSCWDRLHERSVRRPPLPFVDEPNRAAEKEFATAVRLSHDVGSGAQVHRDYDFRKPDFDLKAATELGSALERFAGTDLGGMLVEVAPPGDTPAADDRGAFRHQPREGARAAEVALRGHRADLRAVSFETNAFDLHAGASVSVDGHPHPDVSATPLLLTDMAFDGSVDGDWTASARGVPREQPFLATNTAAKPRARGVQTAKVVGPSGQEIHTDEFGRVRLKFPWDRAESADETSSPWVRVSQGWAGAGFGMMMIPRIGQEVLVAHLDGDPDQPIVVGRVFNNTQRAPYTLPDHQTRSTWRSRSTPNSDGSNELTFEDLAGKELVYLQAERDLRTLVKQDEVVTIGNNLQRLVKQDELETTGANRTELTGGDRAEITDGSRTTIIGQRDSTSVGGEQHERVEGDKLLWVGGDRHIVVDGEKRERIEGDSHARIYGSRNSAVGSYSLSCGSFQVGVGKDAAIEAFEEIHLKAHVKLVLESLDITFKAPGGFIRINGDGVVIQGTEVKINSGGAPLSGKGAHPAGPEPPRVAVVDPIGRPAVDDVSITRLGQ